MQNINELEFVNSAARCLAKYGKVHIAYITAELKPYTKQQKPDLEFKHEKSERALFLTFEVLDENICDFKNLLSTVISYKEFALDNDSDKYIYATNIKIPKKWEDNFLEENIFLISEVKNEKYLVENILLISEAVEY